MEYRTNAIVLKKKEVGETDRFYTLLTDSHGKIQVMAKGVRKPEAKLAGQLENFMLTNVMIVKGKGTGKIAGAFADKSFISLRNDIDVLKRILEDMNMVERLVGLDEKDEELFILLEKYLLLSNELVQENKRDKFFLVSGAFRFQLFAHLGYEIETGLCVVSGERLKMGESHFFSPSAGGILRGEHTHAVPGAFPISESTIKLIRIFLSNKLESIPRIAIDQKSLREIYQVSLRFYQWIHE